jgi:cbb3-type cytochrome oxidase maturation protein
MEYLIYLIPAALFLGGIGLTAFLWSMKTGQYDDLKGASYRALFEEDELEKEHRAAEEKSKKH